MNAEEFYAQFKEMLSYLGLRWSDKHLAKVSAAVEALAAERDKWKKEALHHAQQHSYYKQRTVDVEAGEKALVQERDDWKRAIMERRNSIAKVLDVKANERREREADRKRFHDPAFNEWLDEGISDAGHTVWDATENIADAWSGWKNREYYGKAQVQQPQERECECCSGTGAINERLGGEWNANPAAKCPECDGAGVWEGKAQVQQESYLEGVNIDRLIEALTEAGCASGGHEETAARLADYVNRLTLSVVPNGKKIRAQVQQEPQEALFLLHTGKFYDGEQDEWEIEADSYNTVSAFCHAHPEQTIGLYAAPVGMDKLREAVQKALELARDGAIESLIEALEAMK